MHLLVVLVGWRPIVATFCPLCGSRLGRFGVSNTCWTGLTPTRRCPPPGCIEQLPGSPGFRHGATMRSCARYAWSLASGATKNMEPWNMEPRRIPHRRWACHINYLSYQRINSEMKGQLRARPSKPHEPPPLLTLTWKVFDVAVRKLPHALKECILGGKGSDGSEVC